MSINFPSDTRARSTSSENPSSQTRWSFNRAVWRNVRIPRIVAGSGQRHSSPRPAGIIARDINARPVHRCVTILRSPRDARLPPDKIAWRSTDGPTRARCYENPPDQPTETICYERKIEKKREKSTKPRAWRRNVDPLFLDDCVHVRFPARPNLGILAQSSLIACKFLREYS